ncbi:MAG: hypothetical protein ACOYL9_15850, partial [Ilumatobacteraceae bacterium]
MTPHTTTVRRRIGARAAAACSALSVGLFVVTALGIALTPNTVEAAGTRQGSVTFQAGGGGAGLITSGGSAGFLMVLPTGAACSGSGSAGYRWDTFLVDASVDPGALRFVAGPQPVGDALVTFLRDIDGGKLSQKFPAGSPAGFIPEIPSISLPNTVTPLPLGTYRIGVACNFNQLTQQYWDTTIV